MPNIVAYIFRSVHLIDATHPSQAASCRRMKNLVFFMLLNSNLEKKGTKKFPYLTVLEVAHH